LREIAAMVGRLREPSDFTQRYIEYSENDEKIHVLFISPTYNGSGYHRMLVPAYELNRTTTHTAIVSNVLIQDFNVNTPTLELPDEKLLAWADIIVLPILISNGKTLVNQIRWSNPDAEVILDIDANYFQVPADMSYLLSEALQHEILSTILLVDRVHTANEGLKECVQDYLLNNGAEADLAILFAPNLLSNVSYSEVPNLTRNCNSTIRIGLVGSNSCAGDYMDFLPTLNEIMKRVEKKVELIIFGWDGILLSEEHLSNQIECTIVPAVPISKYHKTLDSLALDLALLPCLPNAWNNHGRSMIRYFDLASIGIPVVVPTKSIYHAEVLKTSSGIVCGSKRTWVEAVETLVTNPVLRTKLATNGFKVVWRSHSYLGNPNLLTELFTKQTELCG